MFFKKFFIGTLEHKEKLKDLMMQKNCQKHPHISAPMDAFGGKLTKRTLDLSKLKKEV